MEWITAHWQLLLAALASYSTLASLINAAMPRPQTPPWKILLWVVLVDWPAFIASRGRAGTAGPFTVPLVTLSKKPDEPSRETDLIVLLPITLVVGLAGCATARAVTYGVLEGAVLGATEARRQLVGDPGATGACEMARNAAVDKAATRDAAEKADAQVKARCGVALKAFDATVTASETARDEVALSKTLAATPKNVMAWARAALTLYDGAKKVAAEFGLKMPEVK
jgi:hypothetical protein